MAAAIAGRPIRVSARQRLDLVVALVQRDIRVGYHRTALGFLWSPAQVLAQFVLLSIVFTRVVPIDVPHYPSFLLAGLLGWQLCTSGLTTATASLVTGGELFRSPGFPVWTLPIAAVASAAVRFGLALPVLLGVVVWDTGRLPATAALLPLVLLAQVLLTAGAGTLLAAAHVRFRDVAQMLAVALGLAFYATPVFYRRGPGPEALELVHRVNPMAHVLDAYRALLVDGRIPVKGIAGLLVVGLVITAVGCATLTRLAPSLVDEL